MRRIFGIVFLGILLSTLTFAQYRNELGEDIVKIVSVVDTRIDGTSQVRHFIMDPRTDSPVPFKDAGATIAGLDTIQLQQLVLTRSWHWKGPVMIVFNQTKLAKTFRGKYKKIPVKYITKRRGNNGTPKMKTGTKIKKDKTQDQFQTWWDFRRQFYWDNNNTIVMTEENWFFRNPDGSWEDPDPSDPERSRTVSRTVIFAEIGLNLSGNRFIGTYYITQADIYWHTRLFELAKLEYQRICSVAFEFAYGYQGTVWSTDMLSNNPHFISNNDFTNTGSDYWQLINFIRDHYFYKDAVGTNYTPNYLSTPQLLPFEMEVLDIGGYRVPTVDEEGNVEMGHTPILFLTNLLALDGKKKMSVKIFRIDESVKPPKDRKIVFLNGNTMRYPESAPKGFTQKIYASIFLNNVRLGRESDLKKLEYQVWKFGEPETIKGVDFDKVIKIKVKLTGFLGEKGGKKTITRIFYLVDTPQPWE